MRPGEAQKTGIDGSEVFDRMRSHWLSNVVHDLSGALFAARGYLRMVLEEPNQILSEPQRRYLTASLDNVSRIITLTQELNDFPGRDWFEFGTVAFHDLLHQAVADIGAASPNVQVIEELDSGLLTTIGDAGKLALAMQAFLAAAFEFTGPGGTVRVQAREENEKIMVEFSAPPRPNAPLGSSPDLSLACKILRLHGGSAFLGATGKTLSEGYLVTCELPVIRLREG
jgi:signal transduction histidine kinase